MVPYVEHTISIEGFLILAFDRHEITPIVRIFRQRMGPGVTDHIRQAVLQPLCQRDLQAL